MLPLLSITDLAVTFSVFEGISRVIQGVSLTIARGEKVAIVGESGCGKSVTARVILGLMQERNVSVSGQIQFDGDELLSLTERRWRRLRGRRIAMIFQDPAAALNPVFTVGTQLATVALRGGSASNRREAMTRAGDMLRKVAITDPDRVLRSFPFQLSGGLNQRVLISMALINNPDLVLADEPGTALDVTVQEQTLRLMNDLTQANGAAVLLITHNLGVVRAFAERVYVMYAGTIVEEADVATLFSSPKHPYTEALLKAVPQLSASSLPMGIDGNIPDYINPPGGCRFSPRCPHAMPVCDKPVSMVEIGDGSSVRCTLYTAEDPLAVKYD
jgi:peptide/nickel transport system ATP-binding protein